MGKSCWSSDVKLPTLTDRYGDAKRIASFVTPDRSIVLDLSSLQEHLKFQPRVMGAAMRKSPVANALLVL
jgi:hypothetical protein